MDLRLHIGVHRAATRHLRTMLSANRELLAEEGVRVLDPEFAERAFAVAIKDLRDGRPLGSVNAELMSKLTADRELKRIVMVDPNMAGSLLRPMGKELFYPRISITLQRIVGVLDGLPLRIFCGVRNPATFVPSAYAAQQSHNPELSFADFIADTNLPGLRWSDFLHRAQLKSDELGITTWRHEDYPKIWREVAQALTGVSNRELLNGSTQPIDPGLSLKGALLLHEYLAEKPTKERAEFDRIRNAFVQKFPSSQGFGDPLLWPNEMMEGMTESYEDDWYYIERMENVEAITPKVFAENA
ncbi:MAG: hypothetical protein AAF393_07960 [Pseudomonadota bacterium]